MSPSILNSVAERFGTPCYAYDWRAIAERIAAVRAAFEGLFAISYAVKSNPNPALLTRMRGHADLLDVSSGGELARAVSLGWDPALISFTGPAKRDAELQLSVARRIGYVICESPEEATRLNALAGAAGTTQDILVRIAPTKIPAGFGSRMGGKPSQFGVDEEDLDAAIVHIKSLANLRLKGFHVYSGTQCLKADAIVENIALVLGLFRKACETHDVTPTKLIIGSGMGVPYHEGDKPLDLAVVAAGANPLLREFKADARYAGAQLVLETGRYLVGEAGVYLTRVVAAKRSRGVDIRMCDGGMNHHLAACGHLGSVLHRNYRIHKLSPDGDPTPIPHDLYGPLCTSIDHLGHKVTMPPLAVGDLLGVQCSGAYGLTTSPVYFISHPLPREILLDGDAALDVSTLQNPA